MGPLELAIQERFSLFKAKRIRVFPNGVAESYGRSMLINPSRERTWNQVLEHVTQSLHWPNNVVYRLIPVNGNKSIHSFTDIVNGERYIACGREAVKERLTGYRTQSECNDLSKNKFLTLYAKLDTKQEENQAKCWALQQAQKNRRTIIYVFSNGQKQQAPAKFVLIENDLYNWPRTLGHIANSLDKPEGIRYLYTVFGHRVCGPGELQHGACYVALSSREKFVKTDYLDNYKEFVVKKRKSGEAIRQLRIVAVGSPLCIKNKNDDCFLEKRKGKRKHKPQKLRETRNEDEESNSSSLYYSKVIKPQVEDKENKKKSKRNTSIKKTNESDKSSGINNNKKKKVAKVENSKVDCPACVAVKNQVEHLHQEEEEDDNLTTSENEVTVEELGVKIVTNKHVDSAEQATQTKNTSLNNIILCDSKKPLLTGTPECGLRVVGADEIIRAKFKNASIESSAFPLEKHLSEILERHYETIQQKLSEISQMKDDPVVQKKRTSVVSFNSGFLEQKKLSEGSKKLRSNTDSNHSSVNSTITNENSSNMEETSGLVDRKSVAIFDYPMIIQSNSYTDTNTKSAYGRRSTGFNFNFHFNFTKDNDDSDDDESSSSLNSSIDKRDELSPESVKIVESIIEEVAYFKHPSDESDVSSISPHLLNILDTVQSQEIKNLNQSNGGTNTSEVSETGSTIASASGRNKQLKECQTNEKLLKTLVLKSGSCCKCSVATNTIPEELEAINQTEKNTGRCCKCSVATNTTQEELEAINQTEKNTEEIKVISTKKVTDKMKLNNPTLNTEKRELSRERNPTKNDGVKISSNVIFTVTDEAKKSLPLQKNNQMAKMLACCRKKRQPSDTRTEELLKKILEDIPKESPEKQTTVKVSNHNTIKCPGAYDTAIIKDRCCQCEPPKPDQLSISDREVELPISIYNMESSTITTSTETDQILQTCKATGDDTSYCYQCEENTKETQTEGKICMGFEGDQTQQLRFYVLQPYCEKDLPQFSKERSKRKSSRLNCFKGDNT